MRRHRSLRAVRVAAAAAVATGTSSRSCRARMRKSADLVAVPGGPGHSGVLADGPEPPMPRPMDPAGAHGRAPRRAPPAGAPGRLGRKRGRLRDRRGLGRHRGCGRRGTAVDAGDPDQAHGGGSSSTSTGPVRMGAGGAREGSPSPSASVAPSGSPLDDTAQPFSRRAGRAARGLDARRGLLADRTELWRTPLETRGAGSRSTERTRSWATEADRVRRLPGERHDHVVRGYGRARRFAGRGRRRTVRSRSPGTPIRGRSSCSFEGDRGALVASAGDPGELHGRHRASAGGGSLYIGSADRRVEALEGRAAQRWATLVLSLFSGDLARFRRRERVRGGHRRWPVPARRRRWWAQVELPSERGRTAELARRPAPAPTRAQRRSPRGARRRLRASGGRAPRPRGWSGRSRAVERFGHRGGGRDAGLIAFEHDPQGWLDVPSPTQLDAGTTLTRWALAAVIVFAVAFLPHLGHAAPRGGRRR